MDSKQLRKLSRVQLLEMLIRKSREADELKEELTQARQQLAAMTEAGTLAAAANRLAALMDDGASPAPAAEYPEKAAQILARANAQAEEMLRKTREECDEMVARAERESRSWWAETSRKMDAFYRERPGLREMLAEQYRQG